MKKKPQKTREEIYDTEIAPLMTKIIAVCEKEGIPTICDFALDDDLKCTTIILRPELEPPEAMLKAAGLLTPKSHSPLMITTKDKDGKVVKMTAIL